MPYTHPSGKKPKILTVFGTRPEVIKLAPVVKALQDSDLYSVVICNTGQHREMVDQALSVFSIEPDYNLSVMRENQKLTELTCRILKGLEPILHNEQPDFCFVQGDTATAFAGALAAFYHQIPVGHVEAGLRTWEKYHPFPEELNRQLISRLATLHFAPTPKAAQNLRAEGVASESIFVTGNTSIDAVLQAASRNGLPEPSERPKRTILVTAHRRENQGPPFQNICNALKEIVRRHPDVEIVYSLHPNPNVKKAVKKNLSGVPGIRLISPPDYLSFIQLLRQVDLVLTDSGGLQEEAPVFDIPVLVLREETERIEAVHTGAVKLVGVDRDRIVTEVHSLLTDKEAYRRMAQATNPYGDGNAARQIIETFGRFFHDRHKRPPTDLPVFSIPDLKPHTSTITSITAAG